MVTPQVIVELEVTVVLSLIPILRPNHTVDHRPLMKHGRVKTTSIPTHQLRGVAVDRGEELPNALGLICIGSRLAIAQTFHLEAFVIAKGTANDPDALQVVRKKIGLAIGLTRCPQLRHGLAIIGMRRISQTTNARRIGDRLEIKNKNGGQREGSTVMGSIGLPPRLTSK